MLMLLLSSHQCLDRARARRPMEELYMLEREVGRGSYGVVFEGQVAKTAQRVAIKRLPCRSPEGVELYLQELWAMRSTANNHVNVIALHDCLLQTGPRSLKPLRPGKLPLPLVESVLKGGVVGVQEDGGSGRVVQRSKSPGMLRDKANTMQEDGLRSQQDSKASTPQRPQHRGRKRSALRQEDELGPRRCLALWLVMEYCDGGDLNQYLLSRPPDTQSNQAIVKQLCSAVAFLHGLGITHRDLKPDNVLVCVKAEGPIVKVVLLLLQSLKKKNANSSQYISGVASFLMHGSELNM